MTAHVKLPDRMVARERVPGGCSCGQPWPCPVAANDVRWAELKAYLEANAAALADELESYAQRGDTMTGRVTGVLRAKAETFALVRQYMDEMEAT